MMEELHPSLAAFRKYPQFIVWQHAKDGGKYPIDASTGMRHNGQDPNIWLEAPAAINSAEVLGEGYHTGFVFTKHDPFWFMDIDKCLVDRQWSDLAKYLMASFPHSAKEISISRDGLHIFGTGAPPKHTCKNVKLGIEFYHEKRFVGLTGRGAMGDCSVDCTEQLAKIIPYYFKPQTRSKTPKWTSAPTLEWDGFVDDEALIKRIISPQHKSPASIFTGKPSVHDLWTSDAEKLSKAYPSSSGDVFDRSSADVCLCMHLAFWTGKDCDRIDRLFRLSALYRDKWERQDYRTNTILKAVATCGSVHQKRVITEPGSTQALLQPPRVAPTVEHKAGVQYLPAVSQEALFEGCVYIQDVHRVLTPSGILLRPEQFRAVYGGYIFAMDVMGDKTSKNAWEAFTESRAIAFPKAHATCFRPQLKTGDIVIEEGQSMANIYASIPIKSIEGDASPFLNHLHLLFPHAEDYEIVLSYMAACVQHAGTKFQWAPVIQGCEGNGKTLLIQCVSAAVGKRYTHLPNATDLGGNGSKFNAWIENKLLIGIEELYVGDRQEVADSLKPLITNERVEVQGKGVDQRTGDNCANFIICSNHKDAVMKTANDRRYCVLYTAQQTSQDLYTAGMTKKDGASPTGYFPSLYAWLQSGGYAVVTRHLQQFDIPEDLNPAKLCCRAPRTTSTAEAIHMSMGRVEQDILEAIAADQIGFREGWVSSMALDRLLKDNKRWVSRNKRKDLMQTLGYIQHPGLPQGRCSIPTPSDLGKPKLYVKVGSPPSYLRGARIISASYVQSQSKVEG